MIVCTSVCMFLFNLHTFDCQSLQQQQRSRACPLISSMKA